MSDVKISVGVVGADEAAKSLAGLREATTGPTGVSDAMGAAKAQADKLSESVDTTRTATDKMGQSGMAAGHLLHGLEEAARGSARGLFAAGKGAQHLLESLGAGAMGGISILIAGVSASVMMLIRLFRDSQEEVRKLNEESAKLAVETQKFINLRLQNRVEDYANMAKGLEAATSAQERFNGARLKAMDARTAADLAKIDLEEAQAMLKIGPGDTVGKERIKLKYAEQRSDVQNKADIAKADQEVKDSEQKVKASKEAVEHVEQQAELQLKVYQELKEEDARRKRISLALADIENAVAAISKKPLEERTYEDVDTLFTSAVRKRELQETLKAQRPQDEIVTDIRAAEKSMEGLEREYEDKSSARRLAEYETVPPRLKAEEARTKAKTTTLKETDEHRVLDFQVQQRDADRASELKREERQRKLQDIDEEARQNARQDQDDAMEEQRVKLADRQARERRRRENVIRKRDHQPLLPEFPESGEAGENIERRSASEARNRDLEDRRRQIEEEQRAADLADRERKRAYETTAPSAAPALAAGEHQEAAAAAPVGREVMAMGAEAEAMGAQQRAAQQAAAINTLSQQIAAANDGLHGAYLEGMKKLLQQMQHQAEQVRQLPTGN